jgi:hypothetical protein
MNTAWYSHIFYKIFYPNNTKVKQVGKVSHHKHMKSQKGLLNERDFKVSSTVAREFQKVVGWVETTAVIVVVMQNYGQCIYIK